MSGWDFDKSPKGDKKERKYTKFAPGVTRIRLLNDAPEVKWIHWMTKFNKAVTCPGKDCPICEIRRQQKANGQQPSYNMSRRLYLNVYNLDTNQVEMMEQGVSFFEDLRDLKEDVVSKGKKLSDAIIRVKRRGEGKDDTSYRLDIDEIVPLSKEEWETYTPQMEDLAELSKPTEPSQILELLNGKTWEEVFAKNDSDESEEKEDFQLK